MFCALGAHAVPLAVGSGGHAQPPATRLWGAGGLSVLSGCHLGASPRGSGDGREAGG